MYLTNRRTLLKQTGLLGSLWVAGSAWAQTKRENASSGATPTPLAAKKIASKLRVVIPANAGGGWDLTGRMIGASLVASGAADEIEYENKGGKGGTIGLTHYVEKYDNDPNSLLVGGMVMLGAVAVNRNAVDMSRVNPIAKLTSEFLTVVVAVNSPYRTITDLTAVLSKDPKSVAIYGGSAGGVDHMFTGVLIRAVGGDPKQMNYTPFTSGKDDIAGVLASGKAQAVVTGYSEVRDLLRAGRVRVLGVSAKKSIYGLPSLREQNVQTDMANWRGLFTGRGVNVQRQAELTDAVRAAVGHPSWIEAVKKNNLESTLITGSNFAAVVENDVLVSRVMVHMLGLKA